jgi:hypothetical protein
LSPPGLTTVYGMPDCLSFCSLAHLLSIKDQRMLFNRMRTGWNLHQMLPQSQQRSEQCPSAQPHQAGMSKLSAKVKSTHPLIHSLPLPMRHDGRACVHRYCLSSCSPMTVQPHWTTDGTTIRPECWWWVSNSKGAAGHNDMPVLKRNSIMKVQRECSPVGWICQHR